MWSLLTVMWPLWHSFTLSCNVVSRQWANSCGGAGRVERSHRTGAWQKQNKSKSPCVNCDQRTPYLTFLFQLPSTEFARRLFIFTVQIEGTPLGGEQVSVAFVRITFLWEKIMPDLISYTDGVMCLRLRVMHSFMHSSFSSHVHSRS